MTIWTPYPGHYEGQDRAAITYVSGVYRGYLIDIYENVAAGTWEWSLYAEDGDVNDLAIARDSADTRAGAERQAKDYIDGL
jgi:hypothetical protein